MATQRRNFTQEEIDSVWKKAIIQPGNNPDIFRKDYAGAWIKKDQYGNANSQYGWVIDHLKPLAKDGTYDSDNLYPLHYKNNLSKGDNYPEWSTALSSDGVNNVDRVQNWFV